MRTAIEKRYGMIEDKIMPAKEVVEKKLAEVEAGEYRAEDLAEIVSKDEVEPDTVIPIWDAKGQLAMRRGSTKVAEPTNAEELRRRLTVLMVMVSLKHSSRQELQGSWDEAIEQYKDYLLREFVYGLAAKDSEGQTFARSYEKAVRKQMVKLTNTEGKPLVVALKAAWKDGTVKERHFTTPLALHAKRPPPPWREQPPPKWRQPEQGEKGKGKGKGKQQKGKAAGHCETHTPEGDPICFRFNTPGEKCKVKKCKYRHCCGICHSEKHAMFQCNPKNRQNPPAPDTSGSK